MTATNWQLLYQRLKIAHLKFAQIPRTVTRFAITLTHERFIIILVGSHLRQTVFWRWSPSAVQLSALASGCTPPSTNNEFTGRARFRCTKSAQQKRSLLCFRLSCVIFHTAAKLRCCTFPECMCVCARAVRVCVCE